MSFIKKFLIILLLLTLSILESCRKDPPVLDNPYGKPQLRCDTLYPVVFVHGLLASGDTWAEQLMRFQKNDYCDTLLYVFDWNTLSGGNSADLLDQFVDAVRLRTGKPKIHLVGHSAGGGLCYNYCEDPTRAAKVASYVHIGSSSQSSPAGSLDEVPTLCISSPDDAVTGATTITGAVNVSLPGKDHLQVATSVESFIHMYEFFTFRKPDYPLVNQGNQPVKVSGRVVILGENTPKAGATVHIYEVIQESGFRKRPDPDFALITDAEGYFGPVELKPGQPYEFVVWGSAGERPIHYFREGFRRDNPCVYLRTLPPPNSLAGLLLGGLPSSSHQSVLAVFTSNQAVISGRDTLAVQGTTFSTPEYTPASQSVIALFLFDANHNQSSDYFIPMPFNLLNQFISARDYFLPAQPPASIPLFFNGRWLMIPNYPSDTEGILVAVFE
ncbi:MAG: alpha/beta fold hydrolase [Flavobacteriales bacterium]|nr:alpha/beta fold hydrolase [Flavobacteriales bacterium]MCX7767631.1 alpha/beta fold hydrolase [Flavobacteriales bacterium]MDW8409527.1 alpha/beta fold hydrolase [Flavobacteriales bacterium]